MLKNKNMYMYRYNEELSLIEIVDVLIDKANNDSVNYADEFILNGMVVTPQVNLTLFANLKDCMNSIRRPEYVKPTYHVVEEKTATGSNYFVTDKCTYADLPISFAIDEVKDNLYTVQDISHGEEGHPSYYLLVNFNGDSMVKYVSDFAPKFKKGELILYTTKF